MASGKVIGDAEQYRLEAPLASGAFSKVYRCTELATGRFYAIKVIDRKVAARHHMKEALIREVNALERAGNSPYVTRLLDKMVSKHNYYLVMELAEGGTLLDLIREQRQELKNFQASLSGRDMADSVRSVSAPAMQYNRVQRFFKQLLLALSSLHEHDIVHRDVKPENILLNKRRTRLVLSDFGFACHAPPGTVLHRGCGTLRYCAPELLQEMPNYDGRKVDVWAAGVTLYLMLFGGHPFRCTNPDPDCLLHVIETTPFRIPRPIPADIADMLHRMLCVDAAQRWSVKELLQHPWMTALTLDPRSASTRSAPLATVADEPLPRSEDCPPLDALPSDEDIVDDGFYQSCHDDKPTSSTGSCSTTQLPSCGPSWRQSHCNSANTEAENGTAVTSTTAIPPHLSSPVHTVAQTDTSPATPMSGRREVLRHGTVFTSMTTIESAPDSDDDDSGGASDGEEIGDSTATAPPRIPSVMGSAAGPDDDYWDHVRHGFGSSIAGMANGNGGTRMGRQASSLPDSSASSDLAYEAAGPLSRVWGGRHLYALLLTAYIFTCCVGFFCVCAVAVVVRVVLRRDIVDLPLPDVVRRYVSFVLSSPLHRVQPELVPVDSAELLLSTASSLSITGGERPTSRHRPFSPLPGSGLRNYVRSADRLMRDSFVGKDVLEHNASLTDGRPALPRAQTTASDLSHRSSPPTPSLSTVVPHVPTRQPSVDLDRPASRPSLNHTPIPAPAEMAEAPRTLAARRSSVSPLGSLIDLTRLPRSAETSAVLVAPSSTKVSGKNGDSQTGATDDTGSGDSIVDVVAEGEEGRLAMFSPSAPLTSVFPNRRHGAEDFPSMDEIAYHSN